MSRLTSAARCSRTADSAPNDDTRAKRGPKAPRAAARISRGSASRNVSFSRAALLGAGRARHGAGRSAPLIVGHAHPAAREAGRRAKAGVRPSAARW